MSGGRENRNQSKRPGRQYELYICMWGRPGLEEQWPCRSGVGLQACPKLPHPLRHRPSGECLKELAQIKQALHQSTGSGGLLATGTCDLHPPLTVLAA